MDVRTAQKPLKRTFFGHIKGHQPDFLGFESGRLVRWDGSIAELGPFPSLSKVIEHSTADTVFILAEGVTSLSRGWFRDAGEDWELDEETYHHDYRAGMVINRGAGESTKRIAVKYGGKSWFRGVLDPELAKAAYVYLQSEFRAVFGIPLLSTPGETAIRSLWGALPKDHEYEPLSNGIAKYIRSNSTQGRIELLPGQGRCGELYEFDGRWFYAGFTAFELPVGQPELATEFIRYKPGWYDIEVTIPSNWEHIGLLPLSGGADEDATWTWPSEPGRTFRTTASEPEIRLAIDNGWTVRVDSGIYFPKVHRPLENWGKKLIKLAQQMEVNPHPYKKVAQKAIKSILVSGIGRLSLYSYKRNKKVRLTEVDGVTWRKLQAESRAGEYSVEDGWLYIPTETLANTGFFMPHWAHQIYAQARVRLAKTALQCPKQNLIAFLTDSVVACADLPIDDTGKIGHLRVKSHAQINYAWPKDFADLWDLRRDGERVIEAEEVTR